MKVWWWTLISTYILSLLAVNYGSRFYVNKNLVRYRANIFLSVITCGILIFVSGFRSGVGDTEAYKQSYGKNISNSIGEFLRTTDYKGDWGFNFFQTFIKQVMGEKAQWMIFICAFITILLIFITFYKYSDSLELAIFYFITSGNYLVSMNGIRQFLVSAILFISFPLVVKRKWKIYFPIVLLASTMHKSALLFIPIYFVVNSKAWGKMTKWMLAAGIFLFVTYSVTGPMIAKLLGESQYGNYSEILTSEGAGANIIRILVYAVPVGLSYVGRRNKDLISKPEYNIVVNMSIINLIFILLANKYWIYARFNIYFSLYAILLLCWCVKYLFGNGKEIVYLGSLFLYGIYYWYEMHISLGMGANYVHFITKWR